ncbi:hypothetical protein P6W79_004155 [Escherichia coli]|uniref:hypothetical protein n=1 Tax=Escherichia coli TaxID=562 RepID=UPI000BE4F5E3|nr:hypothetical protein [Escherichia coli]EER8891534.1 hypothetical protein [Escherichia coli]EER9030097.1 hypothetical protein [Escherichia coli]EFL1720334.1 hypothetical protein [Escherichia coli]EKM3710967.1 hypothetical protein [Escherichia coli]EKM3854913.1 hypothetical protein [Escherichia coli]
MAAFNIPDIYGRFYLVNFDNVRTVSVSDDEECGDLLFEFNDRTRMVISAGLDREGATEVYSGICRSVGAKQVS